MHTTIGKDQKIHSPRIAEIYAALRGLPVQQQLDIATDPDRELLPIVVASAETVYSSPRSTRHGTVRA